MADRLLAGEWRALGLLVDPTTGPTNHPLGTVFHLAAIPDGPGRGETLPLLEHLDVPETLDLAVRARVDLVRERGAAPLVRVVVLHGPFPEQLLGQGALEWWSARSRVSRPPTVPDGGSSDSAADTTDLGALGDWDAEDYRRIRSAEQVWIPEDVALVVLRASDPAGPAAGVAGWGGVDGLGVLPVRLGYRVGKAFTSYDHLSHFDPAPAAVVVVRNRPSHSPLCQGMVVGVGRVRQHLVDGPGSTRVVEATADDEEVVALRRHLLHRVLVEPKPTSALAPFTLYPPPFGDYLGSRHAG